jgi:hypothetical protein
MKTIEELAREAGARELIDMGRPEAKRDLAFNAKQLARFAALVRAEALEEAAKVVEPLFAWRGGHGEPAEPGPREIEAAIRALKDAKP